MSRPVALRFEPLAPDLDEQLLGRRTMDRDCVQPENQPAAAKDPAGEPAGEPVGLVIRDGRFDTVTDDRAIQQDLRMLLSTRRGERVMRPEYGCDLHRLIFEPNDETTVGLAIHYIEQAIGYWEDRITDVRVDADASGGTGRLDITVSYRVGRARQPARMHMSIHLEPGGEL